MRLRLCANIDLKPINIGENMKPEIIEALALELTKATIMDLDSIAFNKTSAKLWVQVYNESLDEIKAELAKDRTPKKTSTVGPLLSNY